MGFPETVATATSEFPGWGLSAGHPITVSMAVTFNIAFEITVDTIIESTIGEKDIIDK